MIRRCGKSKDDFSVIQRLYHIKRALPELFELEKLIEHHRDDMRISVPVHIEQQGIPLPFYVLEMGSNAPFAKTRQ